MGKNYLMIVLFFKSINKYPHKKILDSELLN